MPHSILIVDDSATTRAMIKRTIQMAGIPVEHFYEAPDGAAALEVLDALRVDLVLADLNMPRMSGVEMTHHIRANPATAKVPVVVVSAEPNGQKVEQLKADGIQGYVRKPFTPEAVRNVVTGILGEPHD